MGGSRHKVISMTQGLLPVCLVCCLTFEKSVERVPGASPCCGESPPVASTLVAQMAQATAAVEMVILCVEFLISLSILWTQRRQVSKAAMLLGCYH